MTDWIQPLEMEKWIVNVFSGNPDIFGAIALMAIAGLAGYFRMSGITLFFMFGIFVLMFSGYIGITFLTILGLIGGLIVGYTLSKIFE